MTDVKQTLLDAETVELELLGKNVDQKVEKAFKVEIQVIGHIRTLYWIYKGSWLFKNKGETHMINQEYNLDIIFYGIYKRVLLKP